MRLIKCVTSFMIGVYVSFVAMMLVTGYVITQKFISKEVFRTNFITIDGNTYEIRKKK